MKTLEQAADSYQDGMEKAVRSKSLREKWIDGMKRVK